MALFVDVVKAMSFRKAADATGVPNSTLSRRISELEKAIGLRLLHRTTRKIELTEAGQLYFERCRRIVDEARLAHEQLGEMLAQPNGVLRASLPVDFATTFLAPLIPEFSRRYPGITFDFDLTPRRVDMISEHYDVAIRIGQLQDSNLIARQLASLKTYLYASPRYLALHGEPANPQELQDHECLNILKSNEWLLHQGDERAKIITSSKFTINSIGMIKQLAINDMGIVLIPQEIAQPDVNAGHLVQILHQWEGAPALVYAITETKLLPAKTRCFIDFLREYLGNKQK